MNESTIWSKDDKHALAARVLIPDENTQNLAFRMREIYGPQAWEQVQSQCRACHVAGERTTDHALGVTCEACHGPAKDYVQPHWEDRTTWRYLSPADKEKTGLVNLRDPVTKTETCLSCHLGSMAEGKLVTHDMYAAGHPPLPGFDTATFAAAMPVHWTPLHEKPDAKYKQTHAADHNFAPQTRDVLLAGLTSLASYLELLADYADQRAADAAWPELALYDCFACHHDLQSRSWRQARGYGGNKPGRPPLRSWPNPLALLALQQADAPSELHTKLAAVARSLDEQPFGDRAALGKSARAAAEEIRQALASLRAALATPADLSAEALAHVTLRSSKKFSAKSASSRPPNIATTTPPASSSGPSSAYSRILRKLDRESLNSKSRNISPRAAQFAGAEIRSRPRPATHRRTGHARRIPRSPRKYRPERFAQRSRN